MSILIKNILFKDEIQDIYIQGNRFHSIGPELQLDADDVIDGRDMAIFPSFINAHTHAAMTLLRGYADDMELFNWLQNYIWPFESKLRYEDIYIGSRLACLEMIKTGTTMFCDMYWHMPATMQAVSEMGIRAFLSTVFVDFNDPEKAKKFRSRTRKFYKETQKHDRITFTLGPHAVYTVSRDSLRWLKDFAADNNLLIHIHVAETRKEVADCIAATGKRPVEYLESIGLLGPNCLACHSIWVNDHEMDLLAEREVKVVHNPVSNMKLGSGVFPFREISNRGVCIALGTDGCSSNNNLDMLEEMKVAALQAKASSFDTCVFTSKIMESNLRDHLESVYSDPTLFSAQQALECATVNGAKALDMDVGRIETGMLADCILVNLNHYSLIPGHDLVSNLVYSASSECIDTTICNGKILMQNRKVPDEEIIIKEARQWEKNLKDKA
ncbi:amidohydrolase [Desulfonatronovibrio magnus]|uniref:amidohydrolase n=1 Tax=Desulfonatronovibrio magnus TaxID=698827 RepID=UPI0005EB5044|nr:amidohydrolase [Desulfonatronovibrio magnus]